MRILIIGGTGLISTAVTRTLVQQGHDITLFNRGRREATPPDGVSLILGDRTDADAFGAQIQQAGRFDA